MWSICIMYVFTIERQLMEVKGLTEHTFEI